MNEHKFDYRLHDEITYKALYEEAKAKLDAIAWKVTKANISLDLNLQNAFGNPASGNDLRKLLRENKLVSLLGHPRLGEADAVVNQYGFDTVVEAIVEYVNDLDKTPENEGEN